MTKRSDQLLETIIETQKQLLYLLKEERERLESDIVESSNFAHLDDINREINLCRCYITIIKSEYTEGKIPCKSPGQHTFAIAYWSNNFTIERE
jgi:hypothetical protein